MIANIRRRLENPMAAIAASPAASTGSAFVSRAKTQSSDMQINPALPTGVGFHTNHNHAATSAAERLRLRESEIRKESQPTICDGRLKTRIVAKPAKETPRRLRMSAVTAASSSQQLIEIASWP